jgi:hypothetical protein
VRKGGWDLGRLSRDAGSALFPTWTSLRSLNGQVHTLTPPPLCRMIMRFDWANRHKLGLGFASRLINSASLDTFPMAAQPKVIKILIASPSDVQEERDAIPQLFNRWNRPHPQVILVPEMYETGGTPTMGDHPQHILNKQIVHNCDLAIAVFWSKLGTPTPTAKSGTVEEIREFIKQKGPRRVMVYFCERPLPHGPGQIDTTALALLQDFKHEMQSKCLFQTYTSVAEFEKYLYHHLDIKVQEFITGQLPTPDEEAQNSVEEMWWNPAHPDARLRAPVELGTSLSEVSGSFAIQMDVFDGISGATNDKYLDLGAHAYRSVARSLEMLLKRDPYSLPYSARTACANIVQELRDLAADSSNYNVKAFREFWRKGREISARLMAESRTAEQTPSWTM